MQGRWKYQEPCSFSQLLCFHEVLFKECHYQHDPYELKLMHRRWGDLRHDTRRYLQKKGFKQTYPGCKYGINCIFLFRGICQQKHSQFDKQWTRLIRLELLKTKCPNAKDCYDNLCFYYHQNKHQKVVERQGKLMNQLVDNQSGDLQHEEFADKGKPSISEKV